MPNDTIEVFISYSKQDKELRDGLLSHLRPLEGEGIITWHDHQILPGTEWDDEIRARLNAADIILLLISADFLDTDYCTQVEIPEALRRHQTNDAIVMPVILRSCGWQYTPLARIQAYPEKAKPIKSWSDIDEAYTNVVDGVYLAATEIKKRRYQQRQAEAQRIQKLVQKQKEQHAEREQQSSEDLEKELLDRKEAERKAAQEQLLQQVTRKELQECNSARILFIKNVKHPDPNEWAYSLEGVRQPESRTFELMWRASSHGVNQPKAGDLMILHQRAKVTHVVEFLDDQVRETEAGFFRWVRAVWLPKQDWHQLPHQKDILGFSPRYADGNTHALNGSGFSTFREAWSNLEEFQKHIFKRLTQVEATVTDDDDLKSEKGVDYTRLRDLLKAGQWEEADNETATRMLEAMNSQNRILIGSQDIQNFPLTDLHTIDQLWVKYSYGKFGFSVQRRILDDAFSNSKVTPETCLNDNESLDRIEDTFDRLRERWRIFGGNLGWCKQDVWIMKIDYTHGIENKPEGYLPLLGQPPRFVIIQSRRVKLWWWALLLHLQPWEL
ncbi:GUN4 domain-containing protein [Leptolyngbya sp. FACHB-321]|uniref:GUN4 domain-containing protein n=1 Tax=Leptolyngbya sp. FACHB-321 TaxID=2692807 RepID=UPI0016850AFB|nr:GUN4 domain-containing protein [Leptolyngbya sp. FACHB-321]MBD2036221.1 GUN4 domain-containing protein [Leptolyngbya sp. FACHB-321]